MDNAKAKGTFNILLIEDNLADSRLITEIFKEFDTKTNFYIVTDGVNALKFLNKKEKYQNKPVPNLILLDLNIPKIDGFEVLKEIKTNDNLKNIPILILTTSNTKENFLKAQELQADCFITKPLYYEEYDTLLQHVEACWLKIKSTNK